MHYQEIINHYKDTWQVEPNIIKIKEGRFYELADEFSILEFPPAGQRNYWAYGTVGMSFGQKEHRIELHLFSPDQSKIESIILSSIAHYNLYESKIKLGDTVNFGISWRKYSKCSYGLISLPYIDGPKLENFIIGETIIKFYWLIPITEGEREYKMRSGLDALEEKFDESQFNYINPMRNSLV